MKRRSPCSKQEFRFTRSASISRFLTRTFPSWTTTRKTTGGDAYFVDSLQSIENSYSTATEEARNQYILGYISSNEIAGQGPFSGHYGRSSGTKSEGSPPQGLLPVPVTLNPTKRKIYCLTGKTFATILAAS